MAAPSSPGVGVHGDPNNEAIVCLWWASNNGYAKVVRLLLDAAANMNELGFDNMEDRFGNRFEYHDDMSTPLAAAAGKGHHNIVYLLLLARADANCGPKAPVALAARHGHGKIMQMLLQGRADVNKTSILGDDRDRVAVELAVYYGHVEILRMLLCRKADATLGNALFIASENGQQQMVMMLLKARADTAGIDGYSGHTALILATCAGHIEVVQQLLKARADPNGISESWGSTALCDASAQGHYDIVRMLLKSKAHPDPQDFSHFSPLLTASACGHKGVVQMLLERRADTEVRDSHGRTAADLAEANGHYEVAMAIDQVTGVTCIIQ